ncbi:BrnA antitoxin family protein [Pinirhizobacter sp.]|uniref:BrnA antitoxin family protein n=1 Tax=Pinirhizobacter sp. TaxID=2950432 RepID=UPI0039C98593
MTCHRHHRRPVAAAHRLDRDVVAFFKQCGKGFQTRIKKYSGPTWRLNSVDSRTPAQGGRSLTLSLRERFIKNPVLPVAIVRRNDFL